LEKYYKSHIVRVKNAGKRILGDDLNWTLSFEQRIPKLRPLNTCIDCTHIRGNLYSAGRVFPLINIQIALSRKSFSSLETSVLDPFWEAATTLIQANELGDPMQ